MKINTEYLKAEMKRQGMSGYALAALIGVRPQWIYIVLQGKAGKTLKTVGKIADALNIDPAKLITH